MTALAVMAARMGTRAGELWRANKIAVRNPFRHPALQALATDWRRAFLAAAREHDER